MSLSATLEQEADPAVAWLRVGDTAATDPRVLRVAGHGDERAINEVFGFVTRCAAHSAGNETDGIIEEGEALLYGGARTYALVDIAVTAGLLTKVRRPRTKPAAWKVVDDPNLFNIRDRDELEWERQRKRDAANPELTVPVRIRDGDACRYCSTLVNWRDRRGARRGTYDHRDPGKPATVDTYVVACFSCNRSRGKDPAADQRIPLLPVPTHPFYGAVTLEFLAHNGIQRPGSQPEPARTGDPTGGAARPQRPGSQPEPARSNGDAPAGADLQIPQVRDRRPGAGRDGPGLDGSGPDGAGGARRPRGRRGGVSGE